MKQRVLSLIIFPFLLFYAFPVGAVEKEERNWQDETIYFMLVDRFNNSDSTNDFDVDANESLAYHGGDFQGIIDRLDYIKDMGFTTIGLSPVFDNEKNGYHGYWINDFYKVDEHFGNLKKFKQLIKEAHKRDMKVIIEFPANSVGPNHPWLKDPEKTDWFHKEKEIKNFNNQVEVETGWANHLPDLNHENPDVKKYLIDAAKWWIKEIDIDGFRLDKVNYVPLSFWQQFSKEVKEVKSNFYLIGDLVSNDPNLINQYQQAGLDGLFDYPLNQELRKAFAKPDQSLNDLLSVKNHNQSIYEKPALMGTFMDTYETDRFTRDTIKINQHPGPRWKLALTYLFTTPGIPTVYYGSEIALDGEKGIDNQLQMDFRTDKDLIDYLKKIKDVRDQLPSLSKGSYKVLYEKGGMAVYQREYKGETAVIAINNTTKSQKVTLTDKDIAGGKELRGLLAGDLVRSKNNEYNIYIDRDVAEVYVLVNKTGLNYPYLIAMGIVYTSFIGFLFLVWRRSKKKRA